MMVMASDASSETAIASSRIGQPRRGQLADLAPSADDLPDCGDRFLAGPTAKFLVRLDVASEGAGEVWEMATWILVS
jgi:hypothetical protein